MRSCDDPPPGGSGRPTAGSQPGEGLGSSGARHCSSAGSSVIPVRRRNARSRTSGSGSVVDTVASAPADRAPAAAGRPGSCHRSRGTRAGRPLAPAHRDRRAAAAVPRERTRRRLRPDGGGTYPGRARARRRGDERLAGPVTELVMVSAPRPGADHPRRPDRLVDVGMLEHGGRVRARAVEVVPHTPGRTAGPEVQPLLVPGEKAVRRVVDGAEVLPARVHRDEPAAPPPGHHQQRRPSPACYAIPLFGSART